MDKALKNTHLDEKSDSVPITEHTKISFIRDAVGAALTVELSAVEDKQLLCLDAHASQATRFLHPKQNLSQYTDALFTSIRHNALICIQHHDMASQCIRSPHLIERQFQAYVLKTEYCREMAMRILIGDLARCASRHQRGIKVMFVVDIKDHMLAVVRVTKNNQSALSGLRECRHVIHCLICEERSALPYVHTPIESPYSMLPCDCNSTNPGKTAVLLGPMWMGELVDIPYTRKIIKTLEDDLTSHQKPLNSGLLELLRTLVIEGICPGPEELSKVEKTELICGNPTEDGDSELKNGTVPCDQSAETVAIGLVSPSNNRSSIHGQSCETVSNNTINSDIQTGVDCKIPDYDVLNPDAGTSNSCDKDGNRVQRKRDEEHAENYSLNEAGSSEKKSKLEGGGNVTDTADKDLVEYKPMPLFYYGIHNKRLPKFPKLHRFVECMQRSGYRASRTHFDSTAIRTDANLRQLTEVIQKYNQTN
ncbi:TRMT1-like protein [Dreissena polymorpha]|uniref:TRMT1-like protein n=1 Tax=Dreissena polymorpha TaxID=45954 RepID=UPI002264B190|nr:TRMT1-like protein [Dreissena polymorpha]